MSIEQVNTILLSMIFAKVYQSFFIHKINWIFLRLFQKNGISKIEELKNKGLRPVTTDCEEDYRREYLNNTPSDSICWWVTKR